ncbi:hypothetical protein B0T26DRAFT_84986 [Lasiosphaeria miniovina]|uniref:Zn(2)-C6 fungal-type domain-containing protein n=1 Tax=Lasiosphaeria miniovina TaxID=1954250 RepID=A0AA40BIK7_9PEZI|nr:uncharacterized protein B0T26DRAFT_84986 [Lasiosphaeria miniovina]KAK0734878.1 hypothetical protein B0T26DRAFT_84986 [Lasiosphaeria miniovina]
MDPDQPGGFFSTFSIVDPAASAQEGLSRPQRRNRRVFVCIPCHRRKLKCDKAQPCSRCIQAGSSGECVYQRGTSSRHNEEPSTDAEDTLPVRGGPQRSSQASITPVPSDASERKARLSGASHWAAIAREFEEAWPFIMGADQQWESRHNQIQSLKFLFPSRFMSNFPLGGVSDFSRSRAQILENLPPQPIVDALIQYYFRAFGPTHQLIHPQIFDQELRAFWVDTNGQTSEGWLAQLCMMLALGCQVAPNRLLGTAGRSAHDLTDFFLDAAQFFFAGSSYFAMPTLATVRLLCLAVLARIMEIIKGSEMAHLVFLMGFLTRLAMTMHLHRATSLCQEMPPFESEIRKRIWITIQLLDLHVAMRTGTSFLHRDYDADAPLNVNDDDFIFSPEHGWVLDPGPWVSSQEPTDSSFQIILARLLPLLTEIMNTVNSPTLPPFEYEKVQAWTVQLSQELQDAESLLAIGPHDHQAERRERRAVQMNFLSVIVHRALLALHHDYAREPYSQQFPDSTVAIIESSLALLRTQHTWHHTSAPIRHPARFCDLSAEAGGSKGPQPLYEPSVPETPPTTSLQLPLELDLGLDEPSASLFPSAWLVDLCHDDFSAATFYIILALRRREFDKHNATLQHRPRNKLPLPAPSRLTAYTMLKQAINVFQELASHSWPQFEEFIRLQVSMGCLHSLVKGEPILPTLLTMADGIEQMVFRCRNNVVLWEQARRQFPPLDSPRPDIMFGFGPGLGS